MQTYGKGSNRMAGLLSLREDKHSGDTLIVAINRQHDMYTGFRPYKASAAAAAAGDAAAAGTTGAPGASASGATASGELTVEEVFKPNHKETRAIFDALGLANDGLYSAAEIGDTAARYVKHANLEANAPDPRTLVLDATLCDALFKGVIKKGDAYPTTLPKADLKRLFLDRMQPQTRVARGGVAVLRKGSPQPVAISADKRAGNKKVTRIRCAASQAASF